MILSRATSMSISGDFATAWIANIEYAYALPMLAASELASAL
jgi:hypothetical protein